MIFRGTLALAALSVALAPAMAQQSAQEAAQLMSENAGSEALDHTWSGHRVSQELIVRGDNQLVAYYDSNRQLTLAYRKIANDRGSPWRFAKLSTWIGWDSHNRPAVGIDADGHIHVMANMHVDQMVYFRSTRPWDVRSMVAYDHLVDPKEEWNVTYPWFGNDAQGNLISKYRIGSSGDGVEVYNRYDTATKKWSRMHDTPLVDGEGDTNAYFIGPDMGPDGYFHLVWVWRDTPSADTNHDLSYARSKDLVNWERSNGTPYTLPIKIGDAEIIEPAPAGGGLLNGQSRLGFDQQKRPIISYYKRDAAGDHQIYMLALRDGKWQSSQITNWKGVKLDLDRGGSLALPLAMGDDPFVGADGNFHVRVVRDGKGVEIKVDPRTLKPVGEMEYARYPNGVVPTDLSPGMVPQIVTATGANGTRWYMTWGALPSNQDRARNDIPPASVLRIVSVPADAAK